MSTPGRAPLRAFARRKVPRCALAVPVRVTVLRAGTAFSIPGRSLDLGEGGIAVVLAGEVRPADTVGIEFLLPDLGLGLQAKAVVRHQAALRCGCEFEGLTRHQQAVIREWTRQKLQIKTAQPAATEEAEQAVEELSPEVVSPHLWKMYLRRYLWPAVAVLTLTALLSWWHWQRGWNELEKQIPPSTGQVTVPTPAILGTAMVATRAQ